MKNSFLCILLSICFLSTNAQDIKNTEKIPSSYDRSAITLFFLDFPGENHSGEIKNKIDQISFSEKYLFAKVNSRFNLICKNLSLSTAAKR